MGQWVGPGQIIKNQINLDLIEIIQFCLKINDLLRHPHLWVGVWLVGWMGGFICESTETTWGQHGDHGDVETRFRQHGDDMGTT